MSFAFPAWTQPIIELLGFVAPTIDSDVMMSAESALTGAGEELSQVAPGIDTAVQRVLSNLEGAPAEEFAQFAIDELCALGLVERADVLDHTVLHVPKAYPAYFGTYERFEIVRGYADRFANLFLVGRNGMHRYNNQDHSMLTAMVAVENIAAGIETKDNIWAVNVEQEYHETKQAEEAEEVKAPAGRA